MSLLVEQELSRIHFVAHGMNYLLTSREIVHLFLSSVLIFYRSYLIFIISLE